MVRRAHRTLGTVQRELPGHVHHLRRQPTDRRSLRECDMSVAPHHKTADWKGSQTRDADSLIHSPPPMLTALEELEMMADCDATGDAVEQGIITARASTNERLLEAIDRCIAVEDHIEAIVATVPEAEDPENEIEVDALQWKREMIEHQIRRAVRAGKERKAHIENLRTAEDWEQERARCGLIRENGKTIYRVTTETLKHWFRYWAWALDPRADYLPVQPFVPFGVYEDDESDFQLRYIVWLQETTFKRRKSGVVKKARDM